MIIKYVNEKCTFYDMKHEQSPKKFFWIECTPKEFEGNVSEYFASEVCMKKLIIDVIHDGFHLDYNYNDEPVYYIMVAADLSTIYGSFRAYPISSMHPGGTPFKAILPIYIRDIANLKNINYKILTWRQEDRIGNKVMRTKRKIRRW